MSGCEDGAIGSGALDGRVCLEVRRGATLRFEEWEVLDRDLVCGITPADAGTFGISGARTEELLDAHGALAAKLGFRWLSVPLQVHGCEVVRVGGEGGPVSGEPFRLSISGRVDGQVTTRRGCLLGSTAADCVPAYLWNRASGALGLVHAGWRGVAAEILPRAIDRVREIGGVGGELRIHLGPAICGRCYEVDRPVLQALGLEGEQALVDLRGILIGQAKSSGVSDHLITVSGLCTSCKGETLHSHRASGGTAGRMLAFLGYRAEGSEPVF